MGVDFLICRNCSETFADCGYWTDCNWKCVDKYNTVWCSDECAKKDGFKHTEFEEDEDVDDYDEDEDGSCVYCRKENATDKDLFKFALKKLKMSKSKLKKEYLRKLK